MKKVISFIKKEIVLTVSFIAAVISAFFVPPDAEYIGYIDFRVLCLLFCLMAVVLGLRGCGLFEVLSHKLLSGEKSLFSLVLALVMLPFFFSMLVTNDVALITFVPFTITALSLTGKRGALIPTVVLQTVAANLGSMATPVGNPQNLFIYARYGLSPADFFPVVLPIAAVSLVLLLLACLFLSRGAVSVKFDNTPRLNRSSFLVWAALFALCILSVFKLINYALLFAVIFLFLLIFARKIFLNIDYSLLLTFVCFFIFSGNLGRIPEVSGLLQSVVQKSALFSSALASQLISNVPAAVLLSGFTEDWRGLLAGVNVGGLGTPVASLASLISLKLYLNSAEPKPLRFLLVFTAANIAGLALLLLLAAWLLG